MLNYMTLIKFVVLKKGKFIYCVSEGKCKRKIIYGL